jgi:hypothetical protein
VTKVRSGVLESAAPCAALVAPNRMQTASGTATDAWSARRQLDARRLTSEKLTAENNMYVYPIGGE